MEKLKNFIIKFENYLILLFILIVASFLRFYHLDSFAFTHDEFSAITRTQYNSFWELINFGVIGDGHPAGIQIFLFYWIKLFGISEFWIKLPFIVLGLFSVILTYHIATKWFNKTVGLTSSAFIATLQFFVMYSQIARPYISGMFFCLLSVYFWNNYIFFSRKKFDKNLVGFIIGAVLCSYNHYFSLLFAIIMSITGLFYIKKDKLFYYITSGLIIFLCFIPHLRITFGALNMKGLEWLGKPDALFLIDFLRFLFHYSYLMLFLLLFILAFSYFYKESNKFRIISLVFFLTPFIIGFSYSIFVKPVIQFSVLIFSAPFFIILLCSYLKEHSFKINILIVSSIILTSSISLIFERSHYKIFYQPGFQEVFKENARAINQYKNISSLISTKSSSSKYYLNKNLGYSDIIKSALIENNNQINDQFFYVGWNNPNSITRFKEKPTIRDYKTFFKNQDSDYLFYGWAHNFDRRILEIIPEYYPYLIEKKYYFHSEVYIFSKKKPINYTPEPVLYTNILNFETDNKNWAKPKNITDSIAYSGKYSCHMTKDIEFGATFREKYSHIFNNKTENISCSVKFYTPNKTCSAYLIFSIKGWKKNLKWIYCDLGKFVDPNKKWQTAYLNVQIEPIRFPFNKKVNIYIWNKNHEDFFIDDLEIKVTKGNKNRFKW